MEAIKALFEDIHNIAASLETIAKLLQPVEVTAKPGGLESVLAAGQATTSTQTAIEVAPVVQPAPAPTPAEPVAPVEPAELDRDVLKVRLKDMGVTFPAGTRTTTLQSMYETEMAKALKPLPAVAAPIAPAEPAPVAPEAPVAPPDIAEVRRALMQLSEVTNVETAQALLVKVSGLQHPRLPEADPSCYATLISEAYAAAAAAKEA